MRNSKKSETKNVSEEATEVAVEPVKEQTDAMVAVPEENVVNYGYYSKLLNKPFDTVDALVKAENEWREAHNLELKKAEERKVAAKDIEDAYKHAMDVRKEAHKAIKEADDAYYAKRDAFVQKYGSYHYTVSTVNSDTATTISDIFDTFFNNFWF